MSDDLKQPLGDAWPQPVIGWSPDDTEQFLNRQALPADFTWPHRDRAPDGREVLAAVVPSYRIHKGYGFWLRTTPYFPGLFAEVHDILMRWPEDEPLPEADALADALNQRRADRGQQGEIAL